MPNTHIAVLRDSKGRLVDVQSFEKDGPYASWALDRIARSMEAGDELSLHVRRLSQSDRDELTKQRDAKQAAIDAETIAKRVEAARALVVAADAGATTEELMPKVDELTPF